MSYLFDGTNDVLRNNTTVLADATTTETNNVSMVVWFKRSRSSFAAEEMLAISGVTNLTNHYVGMGIASDNTVWARSKTTSTAQASTTSTITDTSTWHMLAMKVVSGVPSVSLDGAVFITSGSSRDPVTATDMFSLGATNESGIGSEFAGKLAYLTIWVGGTPLSDANVSSMWASGVGTDPAGVKATNCVHQYKLDTNNATQPDSIGSAALTVTAAVFDSDNPFGGSVDTPLAVTSASIVAEASSINLIDNSSYTLAVTGRDCVVEPQDLPFIMTVPGLDTSAVAAGGDIQLVFAETFSLAVTMAEAVMAGQTITLNQSFSIIIDSGTAVISGSDVSGVVPFITAAGGAARKRAARRLMNFRR